MTEQKFKVGDVVELNSGGPKMTVQYVGDIGHEGNFVVQCKWFVGTKIFTDSFHPDSLKKADGH